MCQGFMIFRQKCLYYIWFLNLIHGNRWDVGRGSSPSLPVLMWIFYSTGDIFECVCAYVCERERNVREEGGTHCVHWQCASQEQLTSLFLTDIFANYSHLFSLSDDKQTVLQI